MLKLKAPKLDGTLADVSLLRPDSWLTLQAATVGGTVYISVPECGIDGNAQVLAIEACPSISANPGPGFQIVTGTFQHEAAKTLDIAVEGKSKPIGTTPNHPFWSVDCQAFVRADSLTVDERLQSLNGITTVASITPRGPPEPVYNLEVQVKHTYYVADSGVLVHNGGPACSIDDDLWAARRNKLESGVNKNIVVIDENIADMTETIRKAGYHAVDVIKGRKDDVIQKSLRDHGAIFVSNNAKKDFKNVPGVIRVSQKINAEARANFVLEHLEILSENPQLWGKLNHVPSSGLNSKLLDRLLSGE